MAECTCSRIRALHTAIGGKFGVAAIDCATGERLLSYNSNQRFPLQSVMKLFTVAAVLDQIDQGAASIDDSIVLTSKDTSPGPRRFANVVRENGSYRASLSELMRNAVVESDSTSVDALLAHFGGPSAVGMFLGQRGLSELSVDRSERELQSTILGVDWRDEYCDLDAFEAAAASLPSSSREIAWRMHATDERDSGTPDAACYFLIMLMRRKLVSPFATEILLKWMGEVETGRARLKAGLAEGWSIAHKTGTGPSWTGEIESVSDIGILFSPQGREIAVASFVARSAASLDEQERLIAQMASLIAEECEAYLV